MKQKYEAMGFNYKEAISSNLDLKDLFIFKYLLENHGRMERVKVKHEIYIKPNYKNLVQVMNVPGITSGDGIRYRFKLLVQKKLLIKADKKEYFKINMQMFDLIRLERPQLPKPIQIPIFENIRMKEMEEEVKQLKIDKAHLQQANQNTVKFYEAIIDDINTKVKSEQEQRLQELSEMDLTKATKKEMEKLVKEVKEMSDSEKTSTVEPSVNYARALSDLNIKGYIADDKLSESDIARLFSLYEHLVLNDKSFEDMQTELNGYQKFIGKGI